MVPLWCPEAAEARGSAWHRTGQRGRNLPKRCQILAGQECVSLRVFRSALGRFDLLVNDPQRTKAELMAAGCVLLEEDASVPRIYRRDPHGLVFNLGKR